MVDLASINIDPELLRLIPKTVALEYSALLLSIENDVFVVALPEAHDREIVSDLAFLLGKKIRVEVVPDAALSAALQHYYGINGIEQNRNMTSEQAKILPVNDDEITKADVSADGSIVSLTNRIISDAIQMNASDIHVEPYEQSLRVRYRLDGVLHEVLQPAAEKAKALISRLKIMADLDIAEKRRPQDGRIRVKEPARLHSGGGERVIDIRVSTLPTDFGEKVVLRILDKSQLQLDLSKLGFEDDNLKVFQRTVRLPYGMILVTGPTGSGKTTTLYAALNFINHPEINITTIEDPIEYNLRGINQTHVRSDIGLTFAAALRSILRQDPNVIMVGEIRDAETAEIAIRAALTGHLVFSTLHTNDAPSAVTRLIDMGIEPFLVASSIKMILAQRLLRRLCDDCKTVSEPSQDHMENIGLQATSSVQFYKPQGCPSCNNTGYKGRTAVYEVLPVENGLSDLIAHGTTAGQLRTQAQTNGMLTLREAAISKAARGKTSLDEVIRETAS